jgi:hypothetical protein
VAERVGRSARFLNVRRLIVLVLLVIFIERSPSISIAAQMEESDDELVATSRASRTSARWLCKPTIWVMLCKTIKYDVSVSTGMSRAARPAHELRSARGTAAQNPKISENLDDTHFETL